MEILVTPKKEDLRINESTGQMIKLKVCGYARVSTDLDDQKNSFEFQKEEFESRIKENPDWEFVKMYADQGISGTQIKNRKEFSEMVKDAKAGKIDLILTKSVSRFARNTVDFLQTTRDLAAVGVSVYFEKENITTNKDNIDIVLTLLASLAEAESRSISSNVKWGVRKRMSKNELKVPTKSIIGYSRTKDGVWYMNEDAPLVKSVFVYFLQGYTYRQIAEKLKKEDKSNKLSWKPNTINRILKNEKYKGYVIHQKTVTIDVLTHKRVINNGIEPMYTIKGHHPAIIDEDTFDFVQLLLSNNKGLTQDLEHSNYFPFAGIIYCEECGRTLRKVQYPYNKEYVLTCKGRNKNGINYSICKSEVIPYNSLVNLTNKIIKAVRKENSVSDSFVMSLINEASIDDCMKQINYFNSRIKETNLKINELVKRQIESDVEDYNDEFVRLKAERSLLEKELNKIKELAKENFNLKRKTKQIELFLKENEEIDFIAIKDVIHRIIHKKDGSLLFVLKGPGFENLNQEDINQIIKLESPITKETYVDSKCCFNYEVIIAKGVENA